MKNSHIQIKTRMHQACEMSNRSLKDVQLIWVSKTKPIEAVASAYSLGARHFGENKIQEVISKFSDPMPESIVHIIGPVQSNKLRKAVVLGDWLHTVSSLKQVHRLQQLCEEEQQKLRILFQVNVSDEESKSGLSPKDLKPFLDSLPHSDLLLYSGLMTIGPNTGIPEDAREGFSFLRETRDSFLNLDERFASFTELSMGMSSDLEIAIEEGSTMVRIGTALFGERNYA